LEEYGCFRYLEALLEDRSELNFLLHDIEIMNFYDMNYAGLRDANMHHGKYSSLIAARAEVPGIVDFPRGCSSFDSIDVLFRAVLSTSRLSYYFGECWRLEGLSRNY